MFRVGLGQDSHRINLKSSTYAKATAGRQISPLRLTATEGQANLKSKKPLVLGGILIDENIEVVAKSDGDVVLHAVFNAVSSAIGGRSLGFYDKDLYDKGIIDSSKSIRFILDKVVEKSFKVNNISISIEAKRPLLEPFCEKMKEKVASLFRTEKDSVGITFTTGEDLTAFGKGEGIQAFAIVSLIENE